MNLLFQRNAPTIDRAKMSKEEKFRLEIIAEKQRAITGK
jgi:hypothetical protein